MKGKGLARVDARVLGRVRAPARGCGQGWKERRARCELTRLVVRMGWKERELHRSTMKGNLGWARNIRIFLVDISCYLWYNGCTGERARLSKGDGDEESANTGRA
jgi:hypothetical protein